MYQPSLNTLNTSAPNGSLPLPAQQVARNRARLAKIDAAEKLARFAVLGFCTNPASVPNMPNIQAEIASSPSIAQVVQNYMAMSGSPEDGVAATAASVPAAVVAAVASPATAGSGTQSSLSTRARRRCWSDQPIQVVSLSEPQRPPLPSLSIPNPGNAGVQYTAPLPSLSIPNPGNAGVQYTACGAPGGASGGVCTASIAANFQMAQYLPTPAQVAAAGLGDLPPWGDSFQPTGGPSGAIPASSDGSWASANPGLIAAALLATVALLFGKS